MYDVGKSIWENFTNKNDCKQPDTQAFIKLAIVGSSTIQPGEKLTLQISWNAPQNNAKQILIYHNIGMWGFDTIDLSETERTSGTRTPIFSNTLGNMDCENEKVIHAELYPGGWAVSLELARSNEVKAMWLCKR